MRRTKLTFLVMGVAALALTGCSAGPTKPAPIVPGELQTAMMSACGSDDSEFERGIASDSGRYSIAIGPPGQGWHLDVQLGMTEVVAGSAVTESPAPDRPAALPTLNDPTARRAEAVATGILTCMAPYRFAPSAHMPHSPSALLQLYRYDRAVLWPCLRQHGFDPGPAPSRADFASADDAMQANPYIALAAKPVTKQLFAAAAKAARYCPEMPKYLIGRK
jgi:hypothetical protein